ncbi:MAG: hypothetical protein QM762_09345 [Chryseolinea sp.]
MNSSFTLLKRFAFVALCILTVSCNDDEVSQSASEDLIVMKADYYGFNYDQTVVVTDPNGRILRSAKTTDLQDTPMPAPESGYSGDLVNVYLVTLSGSYYQISAFLNLKRGSDFDGPNYRYNPLNLNHIDIRTPKELSFDRLTVSTDFNGYTIENAADTVGLLNAMYADGNRLFAQVVKNGEAHYGFIDVDQQLNRATLDPSKLTLPSMKKSLKLDPEMGWAFFRMVGSFDSDSRFWGYNLYNASGSSQLDIFYPDLAFAKYFTSLNYVIDKRSYWEERESSELNLDYKVMDFRGNIIDGDPRSFKIDVTGDFDYYIASYTAGDAFLYVYNSHRYGSFSMPDFSQVYGLKEFPFSKIKQVNIQLVDEIGLTEDQENFRYFTSGKLKVLHNKRIIFFNAPVN